MVAEERMQTQRIQGRVLSALCEYFSEKPEAMDTMFWMDYRDSDSDDGKVRAVIDQVASLTDHSAWAFYHAMQEDTDSLL